MTPIYVPYLLSKKFLIRHATNDRLRRKTKTSKTNLYFYFYLLKTSFLAKEEHNDLGIPLMRYHLKRCAVSTSVASGVWDNAIYVCISEVLLKLGCSSSLLAFELYRTLTYQCKTRSFQLSYSVFSVIACYADFSW